MEKTAPGPNTSEMSGDKPVIGLIGGIGSGKSLAAETFARHGGYIVSGDRAGHEALLQPEIRRQIVQRWGDALLDEQGAIRRRRLAEIVFADPRERQALEAIVHPWILERLRQEIVQAQQRPDVRFVVLDAAIMLEAGWHSVCSRLVFVDSPRQARLERIARQRGWTEKELELRESAQLPLTDKASRADHVLDNSAQPAHLQHQVDNLLQIWGLASTPLLDGEDSPSHDSSRTGACSPPDDASSLSSSTENSH